MIDVFKLSLMIHRIGLVCLVFVIHLEFICGGKFGVLQEALKLENGNEILGMKDVGNTGHFGLDFVQDSDFCPVFRFG